MLAHAPEAEALRDEAIALLDEAASEGEALVRFRAAQVACFWAGWHLTAHDLAALASTRGLVDVPEQARSLRRYIDTRRPAIAALKIALGLPDDVLADVQLDDPCLFDLVAPWATFVRAHALCRRLEAAAGHDHLLAANGTAATKRGIATATRTIEREADLMLSEPRDASRVRLRRL